MKKSNILIILILIGIIAFVSVSVLLKEQPKEALDTSTVYPIQLNNLQEIISDIYKENFESKSNPFYSYEILGIDDEKFYLRYYLWIAVDEFDKNLNLYNSYSFPLMLVFDKDFNPDSDEQSVYYLDDLPDKSKLIRYFYPKLDFFDIGEMQQNFPLEIRRIILQSPIEEHQHRMTSLTENNLWQAKKFYGIEK